jgi:hypothetical protein
VILYQRMRVKNYRLLLTWLGICFARMAGLWTEFPWKRSLYRSHPAFEKKSAYAELDLEKRSLGRLSKLIDMFCRCRTDAVRCAEARWITAIQTLPGAEWLRQKI